MIKQMAIIGILAAVMSMGTGYADAETSAPMDGAFIKEHYPDVYRQI